MALKKIIQLEGSTFLKTRYGDVKINESKVAINAYVKIVQVKGDKTEVSATVSFVDAAVSFNKEYTFTPSVEENAPNYIKQAYAHLKTLPEFENSEDC